jgi:hypothetical protein
LYAVFGLDAPQFAALNCNNRNALPRASVVLALLRGSALGQIRLFLSGFVSTTLKRALPDCRKKDDSHGDTNPVSCFSGVCELPDG